MIVALPSVVGFVGGQLIAILIEKELSSVRAQNAAVAAEMSTLDNATRSYETYELLRASFLLDIAASGGDKDFAFMLDQLHRQRALHLLRRVVAQIDPGGWKDRISDYETTVMTDYRADSGAGKKRLQETENAIIADAKSRLTQDQSLSNTQRDRIDILEDRKAWWTTVLSYAGNLLSFLAFFVKANRPSSAS